MSDDVDGTKMDFETTCALLSQSLRAVHASREVASGIWVSFTDEQRDHFLDEYGDENFGTSDIYDLLEEALVAVHGGSVATVALLTEALHRQG